MSTTLNLSDKETEVLFDLVHVHMDMGDEREETEAVYEKLRSQL